MELFLFHKNTFKLERLHYLRVLSFFFLMFYYDWKITVKSSQFVFLCYVDRAASFS